MRKRTPSEVLFACKRLMIVSKNLTQKCPLLSINCSFSAIVTENWKADIKIQLIIIIVTVNFKFSKLAPKFLTSIVILTYLNSASIIFHDWTVWHISIVKVNLPLKSFKNTQEYSQERKKNCRINKTNNQLVKHDQWRIQDFPRGWGCLDAIWGWMQMQVLF